MLLSSLVIQRILGLAILPWRQKAESAEIKIKEIDKKRALIEKRKADQDYFDLLFGK